MLPTQHLPVLVDRVVAEVPSRARRIIDATLGAGGHAEGMLKKAPQAQLLGIDQDLAMAQKTKERLAPFSDRVNIVVANFREIRMAAQDIGWDWAEVILFDLGLSSDQLVDPTRGFSFQVDGPLDMRLDQKQRMTAADIVNTWDERAIVKILRELGEERFAGRIARAITSSRPLQTTRDLRRAIERVIPAKVRYRRHLHPATNTFRALRMAVNDELPALREALPQASELLSSGGKLLVISFHSLEDRIVKQAFRSEPTLEVLTKRPVGPIEEEIERNPRARSAKLRIAQKVTRE